MQYQFKASPNRPSQPLQNCSDCKKAFHVVNDLWRDKWLNPFFAQAAYVLRRVFCPRCGKSARRALGW